MDIRDERSMATGTYQQSFKRYRHTLRMAYLSRGMSQAELDQSIPCIAGLNDPEEITHALFQGIQNRLSKFRLNKTLLPKPSFRYVEFHGRRVCWPLCNSQGIDWYQESPIGSFDFVEEAALGLHKNAEVIYDFGGHHGIWALYYSLVVGTSGRVYSFEPSLINIEISALLMAANGICNVINIGAAVGNTERRSSKFKMLVDFVDKKSIQVADIRSCLWDYADFLKMDIEGYEYEVLTENPWVFQAARNLHIEMHIPHLEKRGLNYRKIMQVIPFADFEVFNHDVDHPVSPSTELTGFCSLMLRRRVDTLQQPSARVA